MSGSQAVGMAQTSGETRKLPISPSNQDPNSTRAVNIAQTVSVANQNNPENILMGHANNPAMIADVSGGEGVDIAEVVIRLNSRKLRAFPGWGIVTPATTQLLLDHNSLPELPGDIGCVLPRLTVLSLMGNDLTRLPDSIAELGRLRELRVDENQLSALPEGVALLRHLQVSIESCCISILLLNGLCLVMRPEGI